ncbi:ANTAR domain-containing protein [Kribbella sp. NPDC059898]|uniref:ANTAR domain-containing protein n=1 Tax=Kribbella sp. NPDC059898 TaxID=3346995 RepID=UPI0036481E5A
MARETLEVAQELADIRRLVDDDDLTTAFDWFVCRVCQTIAECEEAAIAVLTDETPEILARRQRTADHVGRSSREALDAQLSSSVGPLQQVLTYGEPRRIGNLAAEGRWPVFGKAGINAGYNSCLFLALPDSDSTPSALSLFSTKPDAFLSTPYDVVLLLARHAGYDKGRQLVEYLQTALGNRRVIGQAKGILMHRYDISSDVAADLLVRCSQTATVRLSTVALELVDARATGKLLQALQTYGLAD